MNFMLMFGGIIVAGFVGNVLFRITRIPSVLLLMTIGVLLGPVFGVVRFEDVQPYASVFGTVALLIILFEGGLDLNIRTVIQQFGKAILLTVTVFFLTLLLTVAAAMFFMDLELLPAILLGGLVGGTSPAIILPIVNRLKVSEGFKTIMYLEPALADVLIIVTVIIGLQVYETQTTDPLTVTLDFLQLMFLAILLALVAGALWARFIGSLRGESVSYMLTLGFLFLLYWIAEHLGGSGVIAVFFFGMVLANVEGTLERVTGSIRQAIGIRVDATKFALDEFVHNITIELSFLVRVFFFVLLGLLLKFDDLTWERAGYLTIIALVCVAARLLGVWLFQRFNSKYSRYEKMIMHGMLPRGLATAVMAFYIFDWVHPATGQQIAGTDLFPLYALGVIVLTNIFMTGVIASAERLQPRSVSQDAESAQPESEQEEDSTAAAQDTEAEVDVPAPDDPGGAKHAEPLLQRNLDHSVESQPASDDREWSDDEWHSFHERMIHWLRISQRRFKEIDYISTRSLRLKNVVFWLQIFATTIITILGLMMDNATVVLAGMFFSPILALLNTLSLSLTEGDVYMFIKGMLKLLITALVIVSVSAIAAAAVPFTGIPESVLQRTEPTVLDFTLGFFVGIFVPIVMFRGRQVEIFAVSPIVALLVFPSLAVIGYGIGSGTATKALADIVIGGLLSVSANCVAMFIGAVIVLLMLGVVKHEASEYIREWKRQELSRGLLAHLLKPFGIARLLGTTGTISARLIVLALFSFALIIPLQQTINDISETYTIETTIKDLAAQRFELDERSSIISTEVVRKEKIVQARIRVATKEFFSKTDIDNFEYAAGDVLGIPTRLILVQSQGNIGASAEIGPRPVSQESGDNQTFGDRLSTVELDFQRAISSFSGLSDVSIIGVNTILRAKTGVTTIEVVYLAAHTLEGTAETLIRRDIAASLGFAPASIDLQWLPNKFQGRTANLAGLRAQQSEAKPGEILQKYPGISGEIVLPSTISPDSLTSFERQLRGQAPALRDTNRFRVVLGESDNIALQLR